ncbi:hypothetical protein [Pectobacterium sp. CHL-2024]|uniref:hypothetical protein n=1 Tax=Pectobacterium sp. CHL-2024 TaxID=3377079 RepID=UPI00380C3BE1
MGYTPHNGKSTPPSAINLKSHWLQESILSPGCPSPSRWSAAGLLLRRRLICND